MVILSIDPGYEKIGYALFEKRREPRLMYSGLIKTARTSTLEERLQDLHTKLSAIVSKFKPKRIIIERLFFFKNQKTVIAVSQAQGVILLLAASQSIPVEYLTPLQIKMAVTGYGHSDKKSIQKMLKMTLGLNGELNQDDEADAIACGLAYCYLNEQFVGGRE